MNVYRICISNEAGYLLKIHIYKVEEAPDTGILKFFSYTDSNHGYFEHGPMHCLPVSTPYITKAHTETKRSKALGMISHKKSPITIFGHKQHEIKKIKTFDISHEKISTAFGFWFTFGIKLLVLTQNRIKND